MSTPFVSEIRIFSFDFAPQGWALCNGQILPISQNQALFSLLGTIYGGNGTTTYGLPNLQGKVPLHFGNGGGDAYSLGETSGEEHHTLTINEMPAHTHTPQAVNTAATTGIPTNASLAVPVTNVGAVYGTTTGAAMAPQAIANAGGSQPHTNMQPYLVLNFCIALQGIYPSRN